MRLTDKQLEAYVSDKLALPGEKRNEFRQQVNRLLDTLQSVLDTDGSYKIRRFRKAGSLEKGTTDRAALANPSTPMLVCISRSGTQITSTWSHSSS